MKNIVIIGAGPSGLTAALELLRRFEEYDVTVLEADNMIGGIAKTIEINGNRMDIGGHRFHTKSPRVAEFWKSIMPLQGAPAADEIITGNHAPFCEKGADPNEIDALWLNRRRVSRIYKGGKLYDYPVSAQSVKAMGFGAFSAALSYLWSRLKPKKENTLEDFYINRFGRKLYTFFFESYTMKVWGVHPSKLPPDWGAQRVRGLSAWKVVKDMLKKDSEEASLIKSFLYPKLGPGQLWEQTAKKIIKAGGRIILNSPAEKVLIKNGKVCGVEAGGKTYKSDIIISSMPLPHLIAALDGSEIPDSVSAAAENLRFRDFITVGVLVKKLRIKNQTKLKTVSDIPPDCWIYVQDPGVKMGRIQIFNNWSPYMVRDFEHRVFIGTEYFCSKGDDMWNLPDEEIKSLAAEELVKMGIIDENDLCETHCERMEKAYPSYDGSYKELYKLQSYLNGIENLYCIGRNGQHRYNNMDHSMLTAMLTADIILNSGDKADIWKVNADDECGE